MSLYPGPLSHVKSWNVTTGCTFGCPNCWARKQVNRFKGQYDYPTDDPFRPTFHRDRLDIPLKRMKPATYAVSFMGDLFDPEVPNDWLWHIFQMMDQCDWHRFLLLTKQLERLNRFLKWWNEPPHDSDTPSSLLPDNIWSGTSVCTQEDADDRIPELLKIDSPNLWVSIEPMLGPIDLSPWLFCDHCRRGPYGPGAVVDQLSSAAGGRPWHECRCSKLALVILGGESGPGASPMHPQWVRDVRVKCQAAGVPFFFKQWGEWAPWGPPLDRIGCVQYERDEEKLGAVAISGKFVAPCSRLLWDIGLMFPGAKQSLMMRVGKTAAGRLLDDREWNELPEGLR